MEVMIGNQVATSIMDYAIKGDFELSDIASTYVMAIAASMSVVYDDDLTASKIKEIVGEWAKRGFTQSKTLDF
jgi:hypothetical protein